MVQNGILPSRTKKKKLSFRKEWLSNFSCLKFDGKAMNSPFYKKNICHYSCVILFSIVISIIERQSYCITGFFS